MAVNDGIEVREVGGIPGLQEDGAHGARPFLPGAAEVVIVIAALEEGVGDHGIGDEDPAQDIGIDLPEGGEVHGAEGVGVGIHVGGGGVAGGGGGRGGGRGEIQAGEVGEIHQVSGLGVVACALAVIPELAEHHGGADQEDQQQRGQQEPAGGLFHGASFLPRWGGGEMVLL